MGTEAVRIAVSGGRDYAPNREQAVIFGRLFRLLGGTVLLHGCCPARGSPPTDGVPVRMRGVDAWVEARAAANGVPVEHFPALQLSIGWPRCGPERVWRMVNASGACVALPGGKGTANFRRFALELGKPLYEIFVVNGAADWIGPCPHCGEPGDGYGCGCAAQ